MTIDIAAWRLASESVEEPAWFRSEASGISIDRAAVASENGDVLSEDCSFRLERIGKTEEFLLRNRREIEGLIIRLATLDDPLEDLPQIRDTACNLFREWHRSFNDELGIPE